MKLPISPPPYDTLFEKAYSDKFIGFFDSSFGPTDAEGRYLHWDKLRHLQPPEGWTSEYYWLALKLRSETGFIKNCLSPVNPATEFQFCMTDGIYRDLHWIDQNAAGRIGMDKPVTNPHTRDTYLVGSLIEEAISSSQLEGASTTRNVAKEMLRQGRKPKDHSEQMIFNNYQAMQFIREYKEEQLTPAMILQLHRLLTEATLDDANKAGQYRDASDDIHVVDANGIAFCCTRHQKHRNLPNRIERLCQFANDLDGKEFIHPVIRAIILHFMIGYDHPFVDGNGRTARALFYWSMANQQYWLMEFISISRIIKQAPVRIRIKAYLYTETDRQRFDLFHYSISWK